MNNSKLFTVCKQSNEATVQPRIYTGFVYITIILDTVLAITG